MAWNKVCNAALAVASNVGDLTDSVEHVARGEEQNADHSDSNPELGGPDKADNVLAKEKDKREAKSNCGYGGDNLYPRERFFNLDGLAELALNVLDKFFALFLCLREWVLLMAN